MAFRTTETLIKEIISVSKKQVSLDQFILPANELVNELLTDSGYSSTRLQLIETWLAAHFYAILDPRAKDEKAGPVSQENQSKVDLGLNVTHYGQQAMRFDTQGILARMDKSTTLGKNRTVGVTFLGTIC